MNNTETIKNLGLILESEATNYLESSERLFLMNVLQKSETKNYELSENEQVLSNKIIKKYNKFLSRYWACYSNRDKYIMEFKKLCL